MASRIGVGEYLVFTFIAMLVILSATKYYGGEHQAIVASGEKVSAYFDSVNASCTEPLTVRKIGKGGFVCVDANYEESSVLSKIFLTYPRNIGGKESVYALYDDSGEVEVADRYVNNYISIPRYEDVKVKSISWTEDPYDERYWRFIHYSLRELRHLFVAYTETGEQIYLDKYLELLNSWLESGTKAEHSWDDPHGVAFRAMFLTDSWWKLRDSNILSHELSNKMLTSIEEHALYLSKRQNYQGSNNHGVTQASALMLLGVAFPDLPGAPDWQKLGIKRLNEGINSIIDEDGVLIENSPYYHFYVLEKYWEIYTYGQKYDVSLTDNFLNKINGMINYGTYMLKPNSAVPLLGASIAKTVFPSGYYKEMIAHDKTLRYVLTKGEKGDKPDSLHKHFLNAGRTIFRSGWGESRDYVDETHFIFDVGPFRTSHSDYDAFTFNLYSNGHDLIVDPGLYTYEEVPLKHYFQGSGAHNTVVVDYKSQRPWRATAGEIVEYKGMAHQTAVHTLYPGVTHFRTILYIDHDNFVIIDNLLSENTHTYSQMFHFPKEAKLRKDDLKIVGMIDAEKNASVAINQLVEGNISIDIEKGNEDDIGGWCSEEYEVKDACYEIAYETKATSTSFITHLQIGEESETAVSFDKSKTMLLITKGRETFEISLDIPKQEFEPITPPKTRTATEKHILNYTDSGWKLFDSSGKISPYFSVNEKNGKLVFKSTAEGSYKFLVDDTDLYQSGSSTIFTNISATSHAGEEREYEQEDFLPIIGYHHIIADDKETLSKTLEMKVSDYRSQIEFATLELGCNWYTFGDIMENYVLKNIKQPLNACVINFDDSNKTDYTQAMPVLDEFGALASFFVYPNRLDISTRYMTWDEVDELHHRGHEIASHTLDSSGLVTSGWSPQELFVQLNESRLMLEERGYGPVRTFAYPSGESNPLVVETVKKTGYLAARDIAVPNKWRDRRTTTASLDEEHIWHMNYYKPELILPAKLLGYDLTYTSWWQFEEGFRVLFDSDLDVQDDNNPSPTKTSYGVLELPDRSDAVQNKFIVRNDATYHMTIFANINSQNPQTISVSIDGKTVDFSPKISPETCTTSDAVKFCEFQGLTYLNAGPHIMTTRAITDQVFLDKFNMYRVVPVTDEYIIDISYEAKDGKYVKNVPNSVITKIEKTSGGILDLIF
jgi:peptidoglycan/xylan/chitin deacetylase (PgdA/CDA1 family)